MKEFNLTFNEHQMKLLNKALLNMKYKDSSELINSINVQLASSANNQQKSGEVKQN